MNRRKDSEIADDIERLDLRGKTFFTTEQYQTIKLQEAEKEQKKTVFTIFGTAQWTRTIFAIRHREGAYNR